MSLHAVRTDVTLRGMPKRTKPDWNAATNEHRNRKMVTMTLATETVDALDRIKDETGRARGESIDVLVDRFGHALYDLPHTAKTAPRTRNKAH